MEKQKRVIKLGSKVKVPETKKGARDYKYGGGMENWNKKDFLFYNGYNSEYNEHLVGENFNPLDVTGNFFDLKELELYELPEKWCIKPKNQEEAELVGNYFYSVLWSDSYKSQDYFIHSHDKDDEPLKKGSHLSFLSSSIREGFQEITLNEFREFVLKEIKMDNKEHIGWILDKLEFEKVASIICNYSNGKLDPINSKLTFYEASDDCTNLRKAGVLELWFKKVYKETGPILPALYNYKGIISKDTLSYGCATFNINWILQLYNVINAEPDNQNRNIANFTLDSCKVISLSQLEQIVEVINYERNEAKEKQ